MSLILMSDRKSYKMRGYRPDMTIAVYFDVKQQQNKRTQYKNVYSLLFDYKSPKLLEQANC